MPIDTKRLATPESSENPVNYVGNQTSDTLLVSHFNSSS